MKQLLQRLDTGATIISEVPVPSLTGPSLLVETRSTVISAGTERMLVEFGRSNLLAKARGQPDKVRQVLEKMRTDGVGPTMEAVRAKLDTPISLGYCNAGVVVGTGTGSGGFAIGDRVVTNGTHAEYVRVPHTLAARIPDNVTFESAGFTPIAAIGLQGIRLAAPTLGETVVVFGLGLIGLLTVQLLRANGCRVIGIDPDTARLRLAEGFGATPLQAGSDVAARVMAMTGGIGADAVLMTLSSASDEPVHQASEMSRKRGRLVLVGVTGMNLRRDDFYRKELTFAVSCSYGPGRYDASYEEQANDYPVAYVRWTEQRNFDAVLALMATGQVDPQPLISHRYDFDRAPAAYDLISSSEPSLGIVLRYPDRGGAAPAIAARTLDTGRSAAASRGVVAVIGAGGFATGTLLPALRGSGTRLRTIASGGGVTAALAGEKFGFERTTTDLDVVWDDPEVDTVFVLTRHDSHARFVIRALEAGKHVYVEKPLALTEEELDDIAAVAERSDRMVMVGFNRRFAPLTDEVRSLLRGRAGPLSIVAMVNAGALPADHWTQDPAAGGGRIIGEACHWIDLARSLADSAIEKVDVISAREPGGRVVDDIAHISVVFSDGSTAVIHYLSSGSRAFPKERIECFWDGRIVAIENWRRLRRYGVPGPRFERSRAMDKGHAAEVSRWMEAVRNGTAPPIPLAELLEVSRWSIRAGRLARAGAEPS